MAYNSHYGGQSHGQANYGNNTTHGGNNYTATSYGAQGRNDGGGFMGGSQGGSQGGSRQYGKDTLHTCTIMQIIEAYQPHPKAEFKLDDTEIDQVCIVGQIRNVSKQATNMTYSLDDGTGVVDVKYWIDSEHPTHDEYGEPIPDGRPKLEAGNWARVWGKMKAINNKRHVVASAIRPVQDKNEINYHLLEATYVHLYFTRGPPEQLNGGAAQADDNAQQQQGGLFVPQNDAAYLGGPQHTRNLSVQARRVLKCLQDTPQINEGLHTQQIAASTGLPMPDVLKAGDELLNSSLIFTTVDDHTWALLD